MTPTSPAQVLVMMKLLKIASAIVEDDLKIIKENKLLLEKSEKTITSQRLQIDKLEAGTSNLTEEILTLRIQISAYKTYFASLPTGEKNE